MKIGEKKQSYRNAVRGMGGGKSVFEVMCSYRCRSLTRSEGPTRRESGILRRVTGGENGRGEHTRSFTTDEQYTPKARTMSNLM